MRLIGLAVILAVSLIFASLATEAQQPEKTHRIGVLLPSTLEGTAHQLEAFRKGLRESGYIDGRNTVLEVRASEGRHDRLPELARELVRLKVDVIVAASRAGSSPASPGRAETSQE